VFLFLTRFYENPETEKIMLEIATKQYKAAAKRRNSGPFFQISSPAIGKKKYYYIEVYSRDLQNFWIYLEIPFEPIKKNSP
jgi:hypothetical protein